MRIYSLNREESEPFKKVIGALKECGYNMASRRAFIERYYAEDKIARAVSPLFTLSSLGIFTTSSDMSNVRNMIIYLIAGTSIFICGSVYMHYWLKKQDELESILKTAEINKELKRTGKLPENLEQNLGLDRV